MLSSSRRARVPSRPATPLRLPTQNCGHVYRRPTQTPLYPLVQHHLETFLAQAAESDPMGAGVPSWVERDFRAYLRCGILAHGLERLLRYCARPPFALERLETNGHGAPGGERVVYRLPLPAPDGTTALSLTPLEFLERLALLNHMRNGTMAALVIDPYGRGDRHRRIVFYPHES